MRVGLCHHVDVIDLLADGKVSRVITVPASTYPCRRTPHVPSTERHLLGDGGVLVAVGSVVGILVGRRPAGTQRTHDGSARFGDKKAAPNW
jgi:hypothetical protein